MDRSRMHPVSDLTLNDAAVHACACVPMSHAYQSLVHAPFCVGACVCMRTLPITKQPAKVRYTDSGSSYCFVSHYKWQSHCRCTNSGGSYTR